MVVNNKQKSLYTRTCLANKKHIIKISHESKLSSSFLYFKFCFFKLCFVFDIPEIKKNGNVLQGFLHSNKLTEVPNTSDDIRLYIPLIRTVLYSKKLTELPNISDDVFLFLLLTLKNLLNYQTSPTTYSYSSYLH